MSRNKKYKMKAISSAFSEKGGYSAQFVSDGYSVDARTEILPGIIRSNGVQIGEGTAWDLIESFLMACAKRAAETGETVTVGSLVTFGLAIRGWFANKDSKAAKENVRVTANLLGDLRPTVAFSMSNEIDGLSLTLFTVMSDGCALGQVKQSVAFRINGKHLVLLPGDRVSALAKNAAGEILEAECAVLESTEDHIDAVLPSAFDAADFIGRDVTFKVEGRCGDPDAGTQTKTVSGTIVARDSGDTPPARRITYVTCAGHESATDTLFENAAVTIHGVKLAGADSVTFTFADTDGGEHTHEIPVDDNVLATDARLVINDPGTVAAMKLVCENAGSTFDPAAGGTVRVAYADATALTHNVTFG